MRLIAIKIFNRTAALVKIPLGYPSIEAFPAFSNLQFHPTVSSFVFLTLHLLVSRFQSLRANKNKASRSRFSKVGVQTGQADRQIDRHTNRCDSTYYHATSHVIRMFPKLENIFSM